MAKTWQNVVDDARVILQDQESTFRYTNEVLLAILNRGLQELARLRPDAFWDLFDTDDVTVPEIVETDGDAEDDTELALGSEFLLPMMFFGPLVYWTAANAELADDEFTNDGRVVVLMAEFKRMVVSL